MRCIMCNNNTTKNTIITLGEYKAKAKVCNECGNLIEVDCDTKEKRIFENEYKEQLIERRRKELNEKLLVFNLRRLRQNKRLTNKEVSEITGISEQRLSRIEKEGVNIRISTLYKIAYALRCNAEEFVYYIDRQDYNEDRDILVID